MTGASTARSGAGLISLTLVGVAVSACAAGATPGWTFNPVLSPSTSPEPAPQSAPPSADLGSGASPTAAAAMEISASNIRFDHTELSTPAGRPFAITFTNEEAIPHNVAIYADASAGAQIYVGEIFSGPDERTYQVPALQPGRYFFRCDVHPTLMTGTMVVR